MATGYNSFFVRYFAARADWMIGPSRVAPSTSRSSLFGQQVRHPISLKNLN